MADELEGDPIFLCFLFLQIGYGRRHLPLLLVTGWSSPQLCVDHFAHAVRRVWSIRPCRPPSLAETAVGGPSAHDRRRLGRRSCSCLSVRSILGEPNSTRPRLGVLLTLVSASSVGEGENEEEAAFHGGVGFEGRDAGLRRRAMVEWGVLAVGGYTLRSPSPGDARPDGAPRPKSRSMPYWFPTRRWRLADRRPRVMADTQRKSRGGAVRPQPATILSYKCASPSILLHHRALPFVLHTRVPSVLDHRASSVDRKAWLTRSRPPHPLWG
jgi:hypothetical protein